MAHYQMHDFSYAYETLKSSVLDLGHENQKLGNILSPDRGVGFSRARYLEYLKTLRAHLQNVKANASNLEGQISEAIQRIEA